MRVGNLFDYKSLAPTCWRHDARPLSHQDCDAGLKEGNREVDHTFPSRVDLEAGHHLVMKMMTMVVMIMTRMLMTLVTMS